MIKSKKGKVTVKGKFTECLTDLANIVQAFKENGISEGVIVSAMKLGLVEEERKDEVKDELYKKVIVERFKHNLRG